MKKTKVLLGFLLIIVIVCGMVIVYSVRSSTVPISKSKNNLLGIQTTLMPTSTIVEPSQSIMQVPGTAHCQSINGYPDKNCTPGARNPNVTQDNLFQTICKSGYTKTVRPPVTYTNKLKRQQIQEYGYADTSLSDYEEDHLIPLEVGGSPDDPKNLWPEPQASPNSKDSIENLCNRKVCKGEITLQLAQQQIANDWKTACQ